MDIADITEMAKGKKKGPLDPFRRAVLRGLAVLLPPLLTVVIFLWIWKSVTDNILTPLESLVQHGLVTQYQENILPADQVFSESKQPVEDVEQNHTKLVRKTLDGQSYLQMDDDRYVLAQHYEFLKNELGFKPPIESADEFYRIYVKKKYLQWYIVIPFFLSIFLLVLYLLGKFLAAGVGRFFWMQFERVINRLPVIRNVYSSVKQVTDFMFGEREIEYTRVVAVEYPRKGVWTVAMVTGESLLDIRSAANEPVLSVLIPTSPMPFTGFTVTVKKSETIDLNITIDQAFQFIVSCGVVAPGQEKTEDTPLSLPPTDE